MSTGPSIVFATLCAALWVDRGGIPRKILLFVSAAVIAIICSGLNELITLYIIGFALTSFALAIILKEWEAGSISLGLIAISLLGFYVNISAPGNEARIAQDFKNSGDMIFVIRALLSALDHSILSWVINPTLLALSVLVMTDRRFAALSLTLVEQLSARLSRDWPLHIIVPGFALLAVFSGRLVLSLSQSAPIVGRLSNILFAYYLVALIVSLPFLAAYLFRANREALSSPAVRTIAAVVFLFGLVSSPNVATAIDQLPQTVLQWKPDMAQRMVAIQQAAKSETRIAVLEPLRFRPSLTSAQEFRSDPSHWVNRCAARFYNLESIRTQH